MPKGWRRRPPSTGTSATSSSIAGSADRLRGARCGRRDSRLRCSTASAASSGRASRSWSSSRPDANRATIDGTVRRPLKVRTRGSFKGRSARELRPRRPILEPWVRGEVEVGGKEPARWVPPRRALVVSDERHREGSSHHRHVGDAPRRSVGARYEAVRWPCDRRFGASCAAR